MGMVGQEGTMNSANTEIRACRHCNEDKNSEGPEICELRKEVVKTKRKEVLKVFVDAMVSDSTEDDKANAENSACVHEGWCRSPVLVHCPIWYLGVESFLSYCHVSNIHSSCEALRIKRWLATARCRLDQEEKLAAWSCVRPGHQDNPPMSLPGLYLVPERAPTSASQHSCWGDLVAPIMLSHTEFWEVPPWIKALK